MVTTASGIPLTIIAGVPSSLEAKVREHLSKSFRFVNGPVQRSFEFLSSQNGGAQYIRHTIMKCLNSLSTRIHGKKRNSEKLENPSHISIVYLESAREDDNSLLVENFFTFAQCVKIQRNDVEWNTLSAVELSSLFIKAIKDMPSRTGIQGLKYIYLPLYHFTLNKNRKLFTECLERVKNLPNEPPIIKKISPFPRVHDVNAVNARSVMVWSAQ